MSENKPLTWCYFCQVDSHSDAQCWSTRPKYWSVPTGRYLERIADLEQRLEAAEAEIEQLRGPYIMQAFGEETLRKVQAEKQKAIDDETKNPWKSALINELVVDHIYTVNHETDPRKALADVISWNCRVVLDPSVSKEARDLQQQAIDAALESVKQKIYDRGEVSMKAGLPAGAGFYAAIDIIETAVGTNPLASNPMPVNERQSCVDAIAERDARIAELERTVALLNKTACVGLDKQIDYMTRIAELEHELAETREKARKPKEHEDVRKYYEEGKDEYWSASCADVAAAVDREMELRGELEEARKDRADALLHAEVTAAIKELEDSASPFDSACTRLRDARYE